MMGQSSLIPRPFERRGPGYLLYVHARIYLGSIKHHMYLKGSLSHMTYIT